MEDLSGELMSERDGMKKWVYPMIGPSEKKMD